MVALHDCIESPTHINLVMEYCELGDLSHFIRKRDKLYTHPVTYDMARKYPSSPNAGLHEVVIRHFLKQIASALEFLRIGNYVHRDIKPQNLLLLPSPQYREANAPPIMVASHDSFFPVVGLPSLPMLKLADFGFARVLPSTSLADTLCGSPLYMAPEILRYVKYDATADLWSVGAVLYEMAAGKPPYRAQNHVELLRKIEAAQDVVRFPKEAVISRDLKSLIRDLLKRQPPHRLSFRRFFSHPVVVEEIPGLVEDDVPVPAVALQDNNKATAERPLEGSLSRSSLAQMQQQQQQQQQRNRSTDGLPELTASPSSTFRSPRQWGVGTPPPPPSSLPPMGSSPVGSRFPRPGLHEGAHRRTDSPTQHGDAEGLGIRPKPHAANTAPARPPRFSDAGSRPPLGKLAAELLTDAQRTSQPPPQHHRMTEEEKAAQDVADMREYVVIEKKQVEINAFADEIDANRRLPQPGLSPPSSGPIAIRQNTHMATPSVGSAGGSLSTPPRNQALVGRRDQSGSPGSTSSYLTKAIQDASIRFLGYYKHNTRPGKGQSPPQYNPFLAYPSPPHPVGLIGDSSPAGSADDDSRCVQAIEELATRSDVVYGFAEVKFKQIFPGVPLGDQGLGGGGGTSASDTLSTDQDLTAEAIVGVSEEAFVLYIKGLTLLASAMDLANGWWRSTKKRLESARDYLTAQSLIQRVNAVVQWIRTRFNEVLEKTEMVKLKLIEGQNRLPDTHPSHPSNHGTDDSALPPATGVAVITTGVTAEKLMYDRALEMSRAAAIREISYNDLPGCEISYVTAVRMLEVVIDGDGGNSVRKRLSSILGEPNEPDEEDEPAPSLDSEDSEAVKTRMFTFVYGLFLSETNALVVQ